MPSYLTFAEYKLRSGLRDSIIAQCPQAKVEVFLAEWSGRINTRLCKRYAVDFNSPGPVPDPICSWLKAFVDYEVDYFVGGIPEGRQDARTKERFDEAKAELEAAADSEKGNSELPLRNTDKLGASAINKGGPFVYEDLTVHHAWARISGRCR